MPIANGRQTIMLMSVVYAYTAVLGRLLVMALQTNKAAVANQQGKCAHVQQ
jgi:hypothetical protein